MKTSLLYLFLFISCTYSFAQLHHTVAFDSCYIFERTHHDSPFTASALFIGEGNFELYNDSVIVGFKNEEEQGKYIIELEEINNQLNGDNIIWYYSGAEIKHGWECVCVLVVNDRGKPVAVELYSEYILGLENKFARVSRVYLLKNY